mmetsp:Transcript_25313/g.54471  ORF Transcript_25313/g.54471 Transcript_25313/m.54471 type:complete len:88 (-) Transcript_25313:233-496(-)|eukprot:CAMPEP_0172314524 /NCGR_PEP_ID=MMETSP1058-20130122/22761_1 /TAXON_ID=83371 /ORGANISM="Detonula confervacea, Strain CCMP 353" /LENGTH=87 /DNA_ID=CAMNT_0013028415 /DNA_START=155 /DNA_END=418 /DNA_ORIENTATION=+
MKGKRVKAVGIKHFANLRRNPSGKKKDTTKADIDVLIGVDIDEGTDIGGIEICLMKMRKSPEKVRRTEYLESLATLPKAKKIRVRRV